MARNRNNKNMSANRPTLTPNGQAVASTATQETEAARVSAAADAAALAESIAKGVAAALAAAGADHTEDQLLAQAALISEAAASALPAVVGVVQPAWKIGDRVRLVCPSGHLQNLHTLVVFDERSVTATIDAYIALQLETGKLLIESD